MKTEFVLMSAIEMQQYLRREGRRLIRCVPSWSPEHKEGFKIWHTAA